MLYMYAAICATILTASHSLNTQTMKTLLIYNNRYIPLSYKNISVTLKGNSISNNF